MVRRPSTDRMGIEDAPDQGGLRRDRRASVVAGEGSREDEIASRVGFEPTTKGLKVPCSAAELPARRQGTRCHRPEGDIGLRNPCIDALAGSVTGRTERGNCRASVAAGGRAAMLERAATSRGSFGDDASTVKVRGLRGRRDDLASRSRRALWRPVVRLGQWCATGKLGCERDGDGWLIPASGAAAVAALAREHAAMVEEKRVSALAVPCRRRLLISRHRWPVAWDWTTPRSPITPLALDGVDYVVAVWRGEARGDGGLPALRDLAVELDGELLDGEVTAGE